MCSGLCASLRQVQVKELLAAFAGNEKNQMQAVRTGLVLNAETPGSSNQPDCSGYTGDLDGPCPPPRCI